MQDLTPDNSSNDNCEHRKTYIAISARGAVVSFRAIDSTEAKNTIINNLDAGTTWHFSTAEFAFKQIGNKEDKFHG